MKCLRKVAIRGEIPLSCTIGHNVDCNNWMFRSFNIRLDNDQAARKNVQQYFNKELQDYYEFEGMIPGVLRGRGQRNFVSPRKKIGKPGLAPFVQALVANENLPPPPYFI